MALIFILTNLLDGIPDQPSELKENERPQLEARETKLTIRVGILDTHELHHYSSSPSYTSSEARSHSRANLSPLMRAKQDRSGNSLLESILVILDARQL